MSLRLIDCSLVLTISRLAAVHMSHERISTHRSLHSAIWQLNGQSVSLIVTFSLPCESWQLNGLSVSLIVTFSLSSESWQLNGQSVSLIVTFSLPSESWQLNGQSVSPEIRRLRVRFPYSGAQKFSGLLKSLSGKTKKNCHGD